MSTVRAVTAGFVLVLVACPGAGAPPRVSFDPLVALDRRGDAMAETAPPNRPAVRRMQPFAGFKEQFNRHYTDPGYAPARTIYVSPSGSGSGASATAPASVKDGLAKARPGTRVHFQRGSYSGCFEVGVDGTYDAPIVLYAERNADGSRGVRVQCCGHGRASCFNFEGTSYVAVDGFDLRGGKYGVRAVGGDYAASQHSWGIAVLGSRFDGQGFDGILTGAADWAVFERNVITGSGEDDGHGLYISNGSDLNIVRDNDLSENMGATFQINADPASTCDGDFTTADCDAIAGTGDGGRGASDFFLVENNYFHHGDAQGSNFTSVRYSTVRNNVFAVWARHGVSFWSEAADPRDKKRFNPRLGAHHNRVFHNLFLGTNDKHLLQLIAHSDHGEVKNNLFVGVTVHRDRAGPRPTATWLETDDTVTNTVFEHNVYLAGRFDGRSGPGPTELARPDLDPRWFARLDAALPSTVADLQPRAGAPFLDRAPRLPSVTLDRDGKPRGSPADVGPFEL